MKNKLQQYFPMIRNREEIWNERWSSEQQKEFLDFCSDSRGVKMLYDSFAKELLDLEVYPERGLYISGTAKRLLFC